jgi:hypothetical protein
MLPPKMMKGPQPQQSITMKFSLAAQFLSPAFAAAMPPLPRYLWQKKWQRSMETIATSMQQRRRRRQHLVQAAI